MPNQTDDFFKRMGNLLKERENPTDLKSAIIGKVVKLNPIIVQIEDGLALLEENEELEISEWFAHSFHVFYTLLFLSRF